MLSHEISKNTLFFKGQNGILFHKIISLINCKRRYSIYFCFIFGCCLPNKHSPLLLSNRTLIFSGVKQCTAKT